MMKSILKPLAIVVMLVAANSVQAQEKLVQFVNLPKVAQSFVDTYYSAKEVSYVLFEKDFLEKSYEVVFKDGIKVEFDGKGNWKEVDAKLNAVPSNLVPKAIKAYIAKSFPNNQIVQISKSPKKYEVELTNGLDLEFTKSGQFVRIDD